MPKKHKSIVKNNHGKNLLNFHSLFMLTLNLYMKK